MATDGHCFIATGPREGTTHPPNTGFTTHLTPPPRFFDYGVNVLGKICGVFASGVLNVNREPTNVPNGVGVYAVGDAIGIYTEADDRHGTALKAVGGNDGPGGEFSSPRGPQLRLIPSEHHLPFPHGRAGDLLVVGSGSSASLWFCTNPDTAENPGGCWRRVAFDRTVGHCPEV